MFGSVTRGKAAHRSQNQRTVRHPLVNGGAVGQVLCDRTSGDFGDGNPEGCSTRPHVKRDLKNGGTPVCGRRVVL